MTRPLYRWWITREGKDLAYRGGYYSNILYWIEGKGKSGVDFSNCLKEGVHPEDIHTLVEDGLITGDFSKSVWSKKEGR